MPKANRQLETALSDLALSGTNKNVLRENTAADKGVAFEPMLPADIGAAAATPAGVGASIAGGVAGGTDTYTLTTTVAYTAYASGDILRVTFTNANTGAATMNVNSLGAKDIQYKGSALSAARIPAASNALLWYDGTQFQLLGYWG